MLRVFHIQRLNEKACQGVFLQQEITERFHERIMFNQNIENMTALRFLQRVIDAWRDHAQIAVDHRKTRIPNPIDAISF